MQHLLPRIPCSPDTRSHSFLALRLEGKGIDVSWPTLMQDLGQVHAVHVQMDGGDYLLRTDLKGTANHAFAAAGVRPPSPVTLLN